MGQVSRRYSVPCQWVDATGARCPDPASDTIWGRPGVVELSAACVQHYPAMIEMHLLAAAQGLADMGLATTLPKALL